MTTVFVFFFIALPAFAFSQVGVSFHQSNLPFVGVNYEIKDRFRPEARIGVDNYFEELSLEAVVTYDFLKRKIMNSTVVWVVASIGWTDWSFPPGQYFSVR